jgi:hypothetical protein
MPNIDISNVLRPGVTHTLSATTTSGGTATSAFGAQTNIVMVTATAACFVALDTSPTATTASTYLAAATPYLFTVAGEGKAAAITGTGTSSVYITELSR